MQVLRCAFCIAALSAVSSLAWADNIVVNSSTFSALPAGGLSFGYGGTGTAWANSPIPNPPAPQPYAQQEVVAAAPSTTQTVYVPPAPAPTVYGLSFGYGGTGTAWANSPAPQQTLQPDVGAQMYINLISAGPGKFTDISFDPADPAPEPSTFALLLAAAAAICFGRRYRKSDSIRQT